MIEDIIEVKELSPIKIKPPKKQYLMYLVMVSMTSNMTSMTSNFRTTAFEVTEAMAKAIIEVRELTIIVINPPIIAVLTVHFNNGFHDLKYDLKSDLNNL